MAIEDFVSEIASHQFADLLHFRVSQPTVVTNAKALAVLESSEALNRTLTGQETGWLTDLITDMNAGNFTARDFEGAARLLEAKWITPAEFKTLLGL